MIFVKAPIVDIFASSNPLAVHLSLASASLVCRLFTGRHKLVMTFAVDIYANQYEFLQELQ